MRNATTGEFSADLRYFLATAVVIATACGSNNGSNGTPDASLPDAPESIETGPSADVAQAQDSAPLEAPSASLEAGPPATAYCSNKPALDSVTNVSGTWVMRVVGTQEVHAAGLVLRPKSVFYILTGITQSGSAVAANGHYCDRTEIDEPTSPTTVIIPDKWAHTEKVVNRSGTFDTGADGIRSLKFAPLVEFAGAQASADTDPLPTSATDPRVIDEDLDGNPGITINVTGIFAGSLYSVQKQTTSITAVPVARDRFEGIVDFVSEQNVVGASSALLKATAGNQQTYPDKTPCSSTFAMVKVADAVAAAGAPAADATGAAIDCTWVRGKETALFPN